MDEATNIVKGDGQPADRLGDDELDLVETDRLVAALARRHHAIVFAGVSPNKEPTGYDVTVQFLPAAPCVSGLIQLVNQSHASYMNRLARSMCHCEDCNKGREEKSS